MYERNSQLGFSLKPPAWLMTDLQKIIGGVKVTPPPLDIPLPGGRGKVVVSTQPTHPIDELNKQVEGAIPGGWTTIAIVGAALVGFMILSGGRRR